MPVGGKLVLEYESYSLVGEWEWERVEKDVKPVLTPYSQRNPRWRDLKYAADTTFGAAGCYVTCVAMMLSLAGYTDTPPDVALALGHYGVFEGAYLSHPEKIPQAYARMRWDGVVDWRKRPADLIRLRRELESGPVITEVEFRPGGATPPEDQHFVVALELTDGGKDLVIVDPWDGAETLLLGRYAQEHWTLARAIYGTRLLRVRADG
jgi:hypothetical protein